MKINNHNSGKGMYVELVPNETSAQIIRNIIEDLQIPLTSVVNDIHMTVMYSPNHSVKKFDAPVAVYGIINGVCLFNDGECIVLKVFSKSANALHKDLKTLGAVHGYAEYSPHITLCYNDGLSDEMIGEIVSRFGLVKNRIIGFDVLNVEDIE